MSFSLLRFLVVGFMGFVFFIHLRGAIRTFSIVKGQRPTPQLQLFPLAILVILFQAGRSSMNPWLAIPGMIGFAGSLALFERTRAAVRGRFFSYARSLDQPQFLFKTGPYTYIRNPFYSSYLLSYISAAIMFPNLPIFIVLVVMTWFLTSAAKQEEAKFAASPLASEYEGYKRQAGRFFPRIRFRAGSSDFEFRT